MADSTPTAANNSANQVSSANTNEEAKKPLFGGSKEVFDNLEKFERISNPTDDNFDFDFSDVTSSLSDGQATEDDKKEESAPSFDVNLDTPEEWAKDEPQASWDPLWDFDFNSDNTQPTSDAAEEVNLEMPTEGEKKEESTDDFSIDIDTPSEDTQPVDWNNADDISNFDFWWGEDKKEGEEPLAPTQDDISLDDNDSAGENDWEIKNDVQSFDINFDDNSSDSDNDAVELKSPSEGFDVNLDDSSEASEEKTEWEENESNEETEETEEIEEVEEWDEDDGDEVEEVEEIEESDEDEENKEETNDDDLFTDNEETEKVEDVEEWEEDDDDEEIGEVDESDEDEEKDDEEDYSEDEIEEKEETVAEEDEDTKEDDSIEIDDDTSDLSQLMAQYKELLKLAKDMLSLEKKINKDEEVSEVEIIGNNTEKNMTRYLITLGENDIPSVLIKKIEKDYARDEENEHTLEFTSEEEKSNLIVNVDGFKLYEEILDLQDPVKQLQVGDKIKKFIFLFQWKISDLEEKYEEVKQQKEKMKAFRDIFRNF